MLPFYLIIFVFFYLVSPHLNLKRDRLIPFLACFLLILLMGGQTNNPDYLIYKNIFNGDFYSKDPGFGCVIRFLKLLGFTDENFRLGISLIGFTLISITVFRFLNDRRLFYVLYAIYPFMYDVVQARNFLVMSIITFTIPFLINPNTKKRIFYAISILMASTVQKVAILYLPIAFIDILIKKKNSKYFFRTIIIVSALVALNRSMLLKMITLFIIPITGNIQELNSYVGINTTYGWIIFWLEQICIYGLVFYANKLIIHDCEICNSKNYDNNYYEKALLSILMEKANYYMFIFLPLFILDENYTRIIRNLLPLNIIVIIIALTKNTNRIYLDKKRCLLLVGSLGYLVILFYLLFQSYANSIIFPTLYENWII